MTTLAGIQGDGWCVLGADSRVTEETRIFHLPAGTPKVIQVGAFLMGAAGDLRVINFLAHAYKPPKVEPAAREDRLNRFVAAKLIPDLRRRLSEQGISDSDFTIMAAINGVIYEIGSDFSWLHDETRLYGAGSGGPYALAALHALKAGSCSTPEAASRLLRKAISVAIQLDAGSGGKPTICTQYP